MTGTVEIMVAGDFITMDLLLWRDRRRITSDLLAKCYRLNPGLAEMGAFIPVGTKVILPVEAPQTSPTRREGIRLW